MGLIKSQNVPLDAAPFSLRDIESHARAILARAQQQADQMLAQARTEGAKVRQASYDEGFIAGKQDGTRKGMEEGRVGGKQAALNEQRAKLEQLAKSLTAVVAALDSSRHQLESQAGTEVVKLAVAIARRVAHRLGEQTPAVLTDNLNAAVKLVVHGSDVRIELNPAQKSMLLEVLPQLKMSWPGVSHIELIEDASVVAGGCRICTAQGRIDADLNAQIDRIATDLLPTNGAGT